MANRKLASGKVIQPHVMVTCSAHISTHLQRETCLNPRSDGDATHSMLEEEQWEQSQMRDPRA